MSAGRWAIEAVSIDVEHHSLGRPVRIVTLRRGDHYLSRADVDAAGVPPRLRPTGSVAAGALGVVTGWHLTEASGFGAVIGINDIVELADLLNREDPDPRDCNGPAGDRTPDNDDERTK